MHRVNWSEVDWPAIERLRRVFLEEPGAAGPYWTDSRELASYDLTLGRRIAWKWAAVLEPLLARGWLPPARQLVDWGCGTAIASRSVLAHAPRDAFDELILWDHAPAATRFATEVLQERCPDLVIRAADPEDLVRDNSFVLVVSHVLNELDANGRSGLLRLARRAAAILWVEPGTADDSRALIAVREELRTDFRCVAPCPHDAACGMLAPDNARHWCHHFARPPTEAFTERGWAEFGRRLGIDLRRLPYSYLVLDRHLPSPGERADDVRIIGEPRISPGLMKVLRCRADGVAEVELQKRQAPDLWRTLNKGRHPGIFAWREEDGRICGATGG
jgi:Mitochondrial small ribosomal subunit Rsm22